MEAVVVPGAADDGAARGADCMVVRWMKVSFFTCQAPGSLMWVCVSGFAERRGIFLHQSSTGERMPASEIFKKKTSSSAFVVPFNQKKNGSGQKTRRFGSKKPENTFPVF